MDKYIFGTVEQTKSANSHHRAIDIDLVSDMDKCDRKLKFASLRKLPVVIGVGPLGPCDEVREHCWDQLLQGLSHLRFEVGEKEDHEVPASLDCFYNRLATLHGSASAK